MSTRSAAATDPALAHFIEQVTNGSNAAADSVAGLTLRLVGRVGRLEQAVTKQAGKLDKLARKPAVRAKNYDSRPTRIVETGVHGWRPGADRRAGPPPLGRPKGRRDTHRRHRRPPAEVHHEPAELGLLDPDWDA